MSNTITEPTMAEKRIDAWAEKHGITAKFEFVPFSLSRNSGEKQPSLNWKVTLRKNEREFMCFDYMQGCAHAPSYKPNIKYQREADTLKRECETGKAQRYSDSMDIHFPGKPIAHPKLADVLYSISNDSNAIDYPTFEDWAGEFGYDKGSRKGEAIYRTCLEYALKLRGIVGEQAVRDLREATQDY